MELLLNTKSKITKDENDENEPRFEITELTLVLCNIVNNDSQQDLRIFCKFVTNKLFGCFTNKVVLLIKYFIFKKL